MKKIIFIIAVLLSGCFLQENTPFLDQQNVSFQLLKPASIEISYAYCQVSAEDMDTITIDLTVSETIINGMIPDVPFGENRKFEIFCYNEAQEMNYYGYTTADINNIAPVINIVLYPTRSYANVTIVGSFSTLSATEEKIVFIADWSGTYDVYIMDINGANIRQLTSSDYNDSYPQLSPDRKKVSFQRPTGIENNPIPSYIVDIETLNLEIVDIPSEYSPQCLSWHPTDDKFLFHSSYNGTCDIYEYDLLTESVIPLIQDDATNWVPVYSPDGNHILYYSYWNGRFRAYIANVDGTNSLLLNPEGNGEERLPHMNPADSNLVLFSGRYYSSTSMVQFGLFITDRLTGEIQEVVSINGINESWPDWSPDGETVIYERNSGGNYGIYTVNPNGTQNIPLLDTSGNEKKPHWR
ncbi:MAG: hypothetical protein U9O95_00875 [Candidatus Marinimicrobia bacterium]|nr:hypothetical protein [Candidatus Neomarinimicrobiota bacterium]